MAVICVAGPQHALVDEIADSEPIGAVADGHRRHHLLAIEEDGEGALVDHVLDDRAAVLVDAGDGARQAGVIGVGGDMEFFCHAPHIDPLPAALYPREPGANRGPRARQLWARLGKPGRRRYHGRRASDTGNLMARRQERWQSGRMRRSRKPLYPFGYRGFESLPLRQLAFHHIPHNSTKHRF
jgi:hypothetical protein